MEQKKVVKNFVTFLLSNLKKEKEEKNQLKLEKEDLIIKSQFNEQQGRFFKKMLINTIKTISSEKFFVLYSKSNPSFDQKICNYLQDIIFEYYNSKNECNIIEELDFYLEDFFSCLSKEIKLKYKLFPLDVFEKEDFITSSDISYYANKDFILIVKLDSILA